VSDEDSTKRADAGGRNIEIHLSERATLRAVRTDGGFDILVGDDVVIRGVNPDHMRSLVGSVMDTFLPSELASRVLTRRFGRRRRPDEPDPDDSATAPPD
jgi:hypothetical protein